MLCCDFFGSMKNVNSMKKKTLFLTLACSLLLPLSTFSEEEAKQPNVGSAAVNGKTSAAAMAWAVVGITFLVVIGTVIAVTLAKDN
jgi:hypothetical protein